jgi:hypothetical protein
MTSLFNTITSTSQTTFSSIPNTVTPVVGENGRVLASTAYVQANIATLNPALYLNTNTAQTLTGTTGLSFGVAQTITNIDSIDMGGTLVAGEAGDGGITVGQGSNAFDLYIKNFLQPITNIWKIWSNSNTNITSAGTNPTSLSSVAVRCKKMLSGSFVIENTSTPVFFTPNFTSKPVVILTIRSTAGTEVFQTKWVSGVDTAGFYCETTTTSGTLVMNWIAFGE